MLDVIGFLAAAVLLAPHSILLALLSLLGALAFAGARCGEAALSSDFNKEPWNDSSS